MTERQFFDNLHRTGYEVKVGKDISVRPPGKDRFVRLARNFGEGYTLEGATISITIGGIDMSMFYKDGVIAIPQVTGDLEITVTAVESALPYTNLLNTASSDWLRNKRYNSSNALVDAPGWDVSNYVACTTNDVLRFKNMNVGPSYGRLVLLDSSKTATTTINPCNESK